MLKAQSTRDGAGSSQAATTTSPAVDHELSFEILHKSITTQIYETQYGKRDIGYLGGLCLLVNNCLGPALVQMNTQMQLSGWVPTIVSIAVFGFLAFVSCCMLIYAQNRVLVHRPGGNGMCSVSTNRVEFTGICEYYFHRKLFLFSVVFYILTMIVQCVAGIQQTMQLLDLMAVRVFGESCALEIYPNFFSFPCSNEDYGFSVFEPGSGVITGGLIASAIIALPFGFFPLDDSISFQIIGCGIMAVCVVMLGIDLSFLGYQPDRLPAVGSSFGGLVGVIMFNFSLACALPSWNNERKLGVCVKRSISASIIIGCITMVTIGTLGALAFDPSPDSDNNLIDFASSSNRPVTIAAVYIFSLANNIITIPVFSIMIRYTLMEHKIIRKAWAANLLAILLPWLLVIPFSTGSGFNNMIQFGGNIFIGGTCFLAPPMLFLCAFRPDWFYKKAPPGTKTNEPEPSLEDKGFGFVCAGQEDKIDPPTVYEGHDDTCKFFESEVTESFQEIADKNAIRTFTTQRIDRS